MRAFASPAWTSACTGDVPGVDAEQFAALAERARATCPVSLALAGTEITVEADQARRTLTVALQGLDPLNPNVRGCREEPHGERDRRRLGRGGGATGRGAEARRCDRPWARKPDLKRSSRRCSSALADAPTRSACAAPRRPCSCCRAGVGSTSAASPTRSTPRSASTSRRRRSSRWRTPGPSRCGWWRCRIPLADGGARGSASVRRAARGGPRAGRPGDRAGHDPARVPGRRRPGLRPAVGHPFRRLHPDGARARALPHLRRGDLRARRRGGHARGRVRAIRCRRDRASSFRRARCIAWRTPAPSRCAWWRCSAPPDRRRRPITRTGLPPIRARVSRDREIDSRGGVKA